MKIIDFERCVAGSLGADPSIAQLDAGCCVLGIHGCNDVTLEVIERAVEKKATWAVMPCCLPAQLYIPGEMPPTERNFVYRKCLEERVRGLGSPAVLENLLADYQSEF